MLGATLIDAYRRKLGVNKVSDMIYSDISFGGPNDGSIYGTVLGEGGPLGISEET